MMKKILLAMGILMILASIAEAQQGETVSMSEPTVCCEKTKSGLYCQDVSEDECASDRMAPSSCGVTSFCQPGYCFDSNEGTCLDNTPLKVCNDDGGTWSATEPAQCGLGCCALGDQAAFVTLTRCKKLSGFFGLETSWNSEIGDSAQCVLSVRGREKGACVYINDFEKTCKITTRTECEADNIYGSIESEGARTLVERDGGASSEGPISGEVATSPADGEVEFYPGKLCTAEELGTNCAPTRATTCQPGKEEVYFVDTCGNPTNIYDASKISNDNYWTDMKDKSEACNANSANENSQTCGNCNYILGSYCRATSSSTAQPTYGENICASLNCVDFEGKDRIHGESWCEFDSPNIRNNGLNPVGSKYFRNVCINGKISVEPCAEYRQEECLESSRQTAVGPFNEAACRVNRWQDCTAQRNQNDCENSDARDCKWFEGKEYILFGSVLNGTSLDANSLTAAKERASEFLESGEEVPTGACTPKNPPGLNFWEGEESTAICAQANAVCPVTYEKGLFGDSWECTKNCECLDQSVRLQRANICSAMGDCGPNINFVGVPGNDVGYKITEKKLEQE